MTFTIPPSEGGQTWYGNRDPGGFFIRRGPDPCDGCEAGHIAVITRAETVETATGAWTSVEGAQLSTAEPVELGGLTGVRLEGSVSSTEGVSIVYGGYNPIGRICVHILDLEGSAVAIIADEYDPDEPFFEAADEVIGSFEFTPR